MIRPATETDVRVIHQLICELAEYERMRSDVDASVEDLRRNLFGPTRYAQVLMAIDDHSGDVVGFALFFHNFSTFRGRPGFYLEDLFVRPAHRGKGYGKALLRELARLAVERGCARLEWAVLNWNEPAIAFYKKLGAAAMNDWTVYRITDEALKELSRS